MSARIISGDCLEALRQLADNSIDAIVTDPPYGLGFMGKAWDALPPGEEWARGCLRVLKPGGHLLAFGGARTWHRLAVAVEDAGFEIRDSIAWLYSSGFPKSLDVSKAIAKAAVTPGEIATTAPSTDAAAQWSGWGTALKPAFEPIVVARKPLRGTVAANVLEHGTGALNVDRCRIESNDALVRPAVQRRDNTVLGKGLGAGTQAEPSGRWPANVVLDEDQAAALDEQSGELTSGRRRAGGASRFFYCAKAPKRERPVVDGIAHPTVKPLALMRWLVRLVTPPGGTVLDPFAGSGTTIEAALLEGFDVVGVELEASYLPLIQARVWAIRDGVVHRWETRR